MGKLQHGGKGVWLPKLLLSNMYDTAIGIVFLMKYNFCPLECRALGVGWPGSFLCGKSDRHERTGDPPAEGNGRKKEQSVSAWLAVRIHNITSMGNVICIAIMCLSANQTLILSGIFSPNFFFSSGIGGRRVL